MFLRLKSIAGYQYVYAVRCDRIDGKVCQRSIACLGRLDGEGKPALEPSPPLSSTILDRGVVVPRYPKLPIHSAVEFALLIRGTWRLLKGVVVSYALVTSAAIVRYPLLGHICEVSLPWHRLQLLEIKSSNRVAF